MGCGCNRASSQNNRVFSTVKPVNKIPQVVRTNTVIVSQITRSNPNIRQQICSSCQFSTKNSNNQFDSNSRCRKANKAISFIMRDITFLCPIQKF